MKKYRIDSAEAVGAVVGIAFSSLFLSLFVWLLFYLIGFDWSYRAAYWMTVAALVLGWFYQTFRERRGR